VAITGDVLKVSASVHGGAGGAGGIVSATVGARSACDSPNGLLTGALAVVAGAGGAGGAVLVSERKHGANDARLATFLHGGDGGAGGSVAAVAPSGSAGLGGGSIDATLGRGGNGASAIVVGTTGATHPRTAGSAGTGGAESSATLHAGDGGAPGCDGGNVTIHLANSGAGGTPARATLTVGGGNGDPGHASAADATGSHGGAFEIDAPGAGGGQYVGPRLTISNAFNGGAGSDGCAVQPHASGGAGGAGGQVTVPPLADILLGARVHVSDGGNGGDGDRPGEAGRAGVDAIRGTGAFGVAGHPCATSLAVVVPPPANTAAGTPRSFTVTAMEGSTVDATYVGTVHLTSSDAQADLPADYTFVPGDQGIHTFTGLILKTAPGGTVSATDAGPGGPTGTSGSTVVTASATTVSYHAFSSQATVVAGSTIDVWVNAVDAYGNETANPGEAKTLSSSDPQATLVYGPTDTWPATLRTAGQQSVTVTSAGGGFTDTVTITVTPAATVGLRVTPAVTPATAGTPDAVTVAAVDAYGNDTGGFAGDFTVQSSDPTVTPVTGHAVGGSDTVQVVFQTVGSQTLTATQVTVGTPLAGTSAPIVVQPGATAQFVLVVPATATVGSNFSLMITAEDAFGNLTPTYAGLARISSTDPRAPAPGGVQFTPSDAGVHVFLLQQYTAGIQTLTVTDSVSSAVMGSTTTTMLPGPTASLAITTPSATVQPGTPFPVTVTALDAYGNVAPSYAGTVGFSSGGDSSATVPTPYTFTGGDAGVHQFTAALINSGIITVTDQSNGSIHASISVTVSGF
jgi:hypothetical protein